MIAAGNYVWFVQELNGRVLKDKIEKSMELGEGLAGDFADYRYACGVIAGMNLALDHAEDIKKELDTA